MVGVTSNNAWHSFINQLTHFIQDLPIPHAGHGGPNAADFVKQNLFDSLVKNPKFSTDVKTAFGKLNCLVIVPKLLLKSPMP